MSRHLDARGAELFAAMDAADAELVDAAADMRKLDGLLDPALDDIFARLSRKPTSQIDGRTFNGVAPRAA